MAEQIVTMKTGFTKLKRCKIGVQVQRKGISMDTRYNQADKEVEHFANEIVNEYAEWDGEGYSVDWYKLHPTEQNKLIALMVNRDGKDFLAIGENRENYRDEILSTLITMVKADTHESNLNFAECVKKAVRYYYEDDALELIDRHSRYYTQETLREQGLRLTQDPNHGDFIVQRI